MSEPFDLSNSDALASMEGAALTVAHRFEEDFDSLYQEAWEWLLRHPQTAQKHIMESNLSGLEARVVSYLTLGARRRRAASRGYGPEDEVYYPKGVIENLLPLALDPDGLVSPPIEPDRPRSKGDPASGGNLPVMVMDVRRALDRLNGFAGAWVYDRFAKGIDNEHIAASYSVSVERVDTTVNNALRWMRDFLGGEPGRDCPKGCECRQ